MVNVTNKNVISSMIWKFLERGGTQLVQFIVQIILARLLLPDDYGVVAIVSIFITIANVFVQYGFNTALIQKKEIDDVDLSSVLYLNLFVAFILYIIIYFTSPFIADFYNQKILVPVFRILSITLFFGGFNSVQNAVVARNLQFKKYFFSSLIAIVISAVVGIIMAYLQFGVWALVTQQLVNIFIICLVLWFTVEWRPKACFSFKKIKILFSYGWKLLCSSLIDALYTNLYDLVIGKKYASDTLAFYNRGKQFPYMIVNNLNSSISSVLLPVMSIKQDDNEAVKKMVRKSIKMSSFLVFPVMIGLAIVAKPLILLILTDKWLECVPFLQMLCICYAFWPMHTANLQAINALGRSDIFLKLEIIKKIFGIIILIASIPFGVYAMCIGQVISSIFASVVNAFPNKKLLNYSYIEQIKDMLPYFIISICMGLVVWIISFLNISNIAMLILQVFIGGLFYIIISALFKIESYQYILDLIKKNRS